MSELYPGLPLLAALALMPLMPVLGRRVLALLAPAVSLLLWAIAGGEAMQSFMLAGHEWVFWQSSELSRVFALAFILYGLIAGIYTWNETGRGPRTATMAQTAGAVGIVYAGDLLTLYFFWEMLTVSSLFIVWFGGTRNSIRAGFHYVLVHLFGGVCLLAGILMRLGAGAEGLVSISELSGLSDWLILTGVVINAAVPPLHAWLADAYPRASIYGTVVLAAFTTKSAVYVLSALFAGVDLLIWAGALMTLYGVFFAMLENDIRRLLGYHIVSQVGYMVCGAGIGTALAVDGSAAHAFCHIFYKGLLLMSAGAVIHATGRGKLSELGQLAGPMKWTCLMMLIGAASIAGVPLFNGFVSKSMIISASGYEHLELIQLMLIAASMGTFLSIGLKLAWFTFAGFDNGAQVRRPVPASMMIAMVLSAVLCFVTGVYPQVLYQILPFGSDYKPYDGFHLVSTMQLLVATGLGFWLVRHMFDGKAKVTRDTDLLYRVGVPVALRAMGAAWHTIGHGTNRIVGFYLMGSWILLNRTYQRLHARHMVVHVATAWLGVAGLTVAVWLMMLG